MNRPAISEDYTFHHLHYPENLHFTCISCHSLVEQAHPDAGKLVEGLDEDIYQVVDLYQCTNENCEFHHLYFNPITRFDYSGRHYGADVFRYIANEFLPPCNLKPKQIFNHLKKFHPHIKISEATVRRMCDDILKLKSFKIDQKTLDLILKQGFILLGMDGQDPGGDAPGVWNFMDLISNRILATTKFETLDHQILHAFIDELQKHFTVPIIGWVTDKQNVITKCHDTFYREIPHQYCQYHFQNHLWSHLECLDSKVFIPLKKMLNHLYIHTASTTQMVEFEGIGPRSVRTVFHKMDEDFQVMIHVRNKTFKALRGKWLYETLQDYVKRGRISLQTMNPNYRLTIIVKRTIEEIQTQLGLLESIYKEVLSLEISFQQIRSLFNQENIPWQERQRQIDCVFNEIYHNILKRKPRFKLDDCRAFLAGKKSEPVAILGEWCRLWNSYVPGLFNYEQFPGGFRTNGVNEVAFSKEKQLLIARVGKGIVSHMIATRGEEYLRITHCTQEELDIDIITQYQEALVVALRTMLHEEINKQTRHWRTALREYEGLEGVRLEYELVETEVE